MTTYSDSTTFLQQLASAAKLDVNNTTYKIWNMAEGTDKAKLEEARFTYTPKTSPRHEAPRLSDMLDFGETSAARLIKLDSDADAWMTKYFPNAGSLDGLAEDWMAGVISGIKPFGLDSTVFDLVWHRARDRAHRTMASEQRQIESVFASRGFTVPPGAMVAAISESVERAGVAILEVNREQAVKDAEIKQALLQFAIEQATNYKRGILAALADFYRQWAILPNDDMERARIRAQATSSFYSALSSYANVEVAYEELHMKARQLAAEVDQGIDRNRIAMLQATDNPGKAAALGQAARASADIAAQAAQSAGTLVAEIGMV